MNRKALSAVMRRAQIVDFAYKRQIFSDGWFTVADVARKLGLAPSAKLKALITSLVDLDMLEESCETYHGAVKVRYLYRMHKAAVRRHEKANPQVRQIVINGKVETVVTS